MVPVTRLPFSAAGKVTVRQISVVYDRYPFMGSTERLVKVYSKPTPVTVTWSTASTV